ncbi:type VII secretion protein EsaA [Streptococcus ferus]|uniref:type VII secretion protein EsaA n=1 Tax=Streptococcus ferus TaxID=1345 RepID=UPI0035A1B434
MVFLKKKLPRSVKVIVNIVFVLVLLTTIIGLNILVQKSSNNKNETSNQSDRLNVAVVNEDKTVVDKNTSYNLGADYVKTIERDESQNWTIASRSTAEAGLKRGDYQLVVYIPSNFSSKILDINSVVVDKVTVTYKVNAKGNARVESAANKVGNDIVSSLNSQLINMYLASILGNLYTAQQNAQLVSDIQNDNIGSYQGNLYKSSLSFPTVFPSLVSLANSSLSANDSLAKLLNTSADNANSDGSDTSNILTDLQSLLSEYSQGTISEKQFIEGVFQQNPNELSSQIDLIIANLEADKGSIAQLLESDSGEGGSSEPGNTPNQDKAYKELTNTLNTQLDELEKQLQTVAEKDKDNPAVKDVETIVEEELSSYYGKDIERLNEITLADILEQGNVGLTTSLKDYKASINTMVSNAASTLPSDKAADIAGDLKGVTDTDYSLKITQYSDATPVSNYGYSAANNNLKASLGNAAAAVRGYNTDNLNATTTVSTKVQASLAATGVDVESWYLVEDGQVQAPVAPSSEITVDLSKNNEFHYNIKQATAAEGEQGGNTETGTASIKVSVGGVQITEGQRFNLTDYRATVEQYTTTAQMVVDAYNNAGSLLTTYYPNGSQTNLTDSFFNQSAKTLLVNLLTQAVENSLDTYSANRDVKDVLETLRTTRENLVENMEKIQKQNDNVESDINDSITLLKSIKATQTAGNESEQADNERTRKSSDLSGRISKLVSQSESLKTSAASNAKAASSVSSSFESFNKAVETAQTDGQTLSEEAQKLMNKFNAELTESNDFVKSFITVLDNAYNNGVPNEALLEFLSSPVATRTTSYKSQVNTYRPFTWVLLLGVITLFTAYLFATQDLIRRVKNKFTKGLFADTDILNVLLLSALALVEGIVLGAVSSRIMVLDRDLIPSWILIFVLFSFLLLHGQYFLLKHMKALGMGLSLYTLVTFVYFSNATGMAVATTDFAQKLKMWNILSLMEEKLSLYFDHITVGAGVVSALFISIIIIIILNIVVRFPWENHSYKVSES